MSDEIISKLSEYIVSEVLRQPGRVLGPDEPLLTSGLIDSFHLVDLGLFVDDTFGVRIDDTELNASTFDNLNQLAALIRSRKA